MMLWPHANARYQQETRRLACGELQLMLSKIASEAACAFDEGAEVPCLQIEGTLDEAALQIIQYHSLLYQLFEQRPDGSLFPLITRAPAVLGSDLPAILKYKGKTNEMFLMLLINLALYSGDFWREEGALEFLDPMCGRATAPFIALNRGFNAVGLDVDKNDLKEAEHFFKRYLEYHRFKHHLTRDSRTLKSGKSAPMTRFELTSQNQRLDLITLDAARSAEALKKNSVHLIACDLPYGVNHAAQPGQPVKGNWLEALLKQALPALYAVLKPGGTAALSFNAQNFKREKLCHLMIEAGFEVCSGELYDGFEHWVEQAIMRDVVVGKKRRA